MKLINDSVSPETLNIGDWVVISGKVRQIESIGWSRPCQWYATKFVDDSEEQHIYEHEIINRVSAVLEIR